MTVAFVNPEVSGFVDRIHVNFSYYDSSDYSLNTIRTIFDELELIDDDTKTYQSKGKIDVGGGLPYGTYDKIDFCLYDKVGNSKEFSNYMNSPTGNLPENSEIAIEWKSDINPLDKNNDFYTKKITVRANGKFSILKENSGYGYVYLNDTTWMEFPTKDELIKAQEKIEKYDLSKPQKITVPINYKIEVSKGIIRELSVDQEIELIEVKGIVKEDQNNKELSLRYDALFDENGMLNYDLGYIFPTTVIMNDKTEKVIYSKIGRGEQSFGSSQGLSFVEFGGSFALPSLEYDVPESMKNEVHPIEFFSRYRFYLIDKEGNLVDHYRNVLKAKEDREEVTYETKNDAVNVSSLEGTLPSYTTVTAVETNVDHVFDGLANVAYDIQLEANSGTVQPVETVDVTIDLPNDLKGRQVEVYYVDDNGNKSLVEGSKVNGNTVTFTTDHFSTYAIVAKDKEVKELVALSDTKVIELGELFSTQASDYINTDKSDAELLKNAKVSVNVKRYFRAADGTFYPAVGKHTIKITSGDKVVEITGIVKDTKPPVLKVNKSEIITNIGERIEYSIYLASARDIGGVEIILDDSKVDYNKEGKYELVVIAIDDSGNIASQTIVAIVEKSEIESITIAQIKPTEKIYVDISNDKKAETILKESISVNKGLEQSVLESIKEGKDVKVVAKQLLLDPKKATGEVKKDIEKISVVANQNDLKVAQYLDLTLQVLANDEHLGNITTTTEMLTFQLPIPKELQKEGRTFQIGRVHEGETKLLPTIEKDGILIFKSKEFSTYALLYKDAKGNSVNTGDNSGVMFYTGLCGIALLGILLIQLRKRNSFTK